MWFSKMAMVFFFQTEVCRTLKSASELSTHFLTREELQELVGAEDRLSFKLEPHEKPILSSWARPKRWLMGD